jgi:type I restriction enzyme S subunit
MADRSSVGDFVSLQRGTTYKGSLVGKPGPALLGLGSIRPGGGFRDGDYKTYGGDCPKNLMLFPGDLFVSLKGATKDGEMIGSIARVPSAVASGRLTQDTVKLVFHEPDERTSNFLYWLLRTPQYRSYCAGRATGSAVVALSRDDFLAYPVPQITPIRLRVAELLEELESKIELNRKVNETIEAMARALFKSWFVDFDPVHAKAEGRDPGVPMSIAALFPDSFEDSELGEIPAGWTVGMLGKVLSQRLERCARSTETMARPYVPIECITARSLFLSESKAGEEAQSSLTKFYKGDLLFGAMRPYFHKVCIAPFDGTTRTTVFVLFPKQVSDFSFATLLLHHPNTIDYATRHSTGTTIPYAMWNGSLENMPVLLPPSELRQAFNNAVYPILSRIPKPYFENLTLATLRDLLLPKLISGDLQIAGAGDNHEEGA